MDRGLIIIASVILVILSSWLLNDLEVIDVPWFQSERSLQTGQAIGELKFVRNQVRRRALNQLVWEDGGQSNPIFNKDSVLTLDNSSAIVRLANDVELKLSENTLVLIETSENEKAEQKIRLRFEQGALTTQRLAKGTKFETKTFTIDAKEGSQIQLRSFKENIELEVIEGAAEVKSNDDENVVKVEAGTVTQIDEEQNVEVKEVNLDLKLVGEISDRVYSHQFPVVYPLSWQGDPQKIVLEKLGESRLVIPINSQFKEQDIFLFPGTYFVRLIGENQVSEAKTVEVRNAPIVHLVSPLPRDRRPAGIPVSFQWISQRSLSKFKIRIFDKEQSKFIDHPSDDNQKVIEDLNKGNKNWQVIGIDNDGFEIPALYDNKLYITPKPLSAPKIKSIDVFKKQHDSNQSIPQKKNQNENQTKGKQSTSSLWKNLWKLLLTQSHAKTPKQNEEIEINFQWETVEGADFYLVEISRTADFRNLLQETRIDALNYRWVTRDQGEIFWRVAGGANDGRMGLFSDPQKLSIDQLRLIAKVKEKKIDKSISVRRVTKPKLVAQPKPTPTPLPTPTPTPEPQEDQAETPEVAPSPQDETPEIVRNHRFWGLWTPKYVSNKLRGTESSTGEFSGLGIGATTIGASLDLNAGFQYYIEAKYYQHNWAEKVLGSTSNTPRLEEQHYSLDLGIESKATYWTYGFAIGSTPDLKRAGAELLEFKQNSYYGLFALIQLPVLANDLLKVRTALSFGPKLIQLEFSSDWKFVIIEFNTINAIIQPGFYYTHLAYNGRDASQRLGVQLGLGIEF